MKMFFHSQRDEWQDMINHGRDGWLWKYFWLYNYKYTDEKSVLTIMQENNREKLSDQAR